MNNKPLIYKGTYFLICIKQGILNRVIYICTYIYIYIYISTISPVLLTLKGWILCKGYCLQALRLFISAEDVADMLLVQHSIFWSVAAWPPTKSNMVNKEQPIGNIYIQCNTKIIYLYMYIYINIDRRSHLFLGPHHVLNG